MEMVRCFRRLIPLSDGDHPLANGAIKTLRGGHGPPRTRATLASSAKPKAPVQGALWTHCNSPCKKTGKFASRVPAPHTNFSAKETPLPWPFFLRYPDTTSP